MPSMAENHPDPGRSGRELKGGGLTGNLIIIGLISLGLLPKAAIEATYFRDYEAARRTLSSWVLSAGAVLCALSLSLLLDHMC